MQTARRVNDSKPGYVAERVLAMTEPNETIACLGLSYKADTDDLRESPAVDVVKKLAPRHFGGVVAVEPNIKRFPPALNEAGVKQMELTDALDAAQVVVLLVDHREFRQLDPDALTGKKIYDSRGIWIDTCPQTADLPQLTAAE